MDKEWLFVGDSLDEGGPIATVEQFRDGKTSYAHLFPNGQIKRFDICIGRVEDVEVLGEIEVKVSGEGYDKWLSGGFRV